MGERKITPLEVGEDDWFADCPFIPIMSGDDKLAEVIPADGEELTEDDRDAAAFIVRACNSYDELTGAIEELLAADRALIAAERMDDGVESAHTRWEIAKQRTAAALAKAREA